MSNTSSQTQQLNQLAAIRYPEAMNGGDQNLVMFNLDNGSIERGPVGAGSIPVYCCLYQNPTTSAISLEIKFLIDQLLSLGPNVKVYCLKGRSTEPSTNFIPTHKDMFVKLKEGLIQYERMTQTQSQSTNGLQMPLSSASSQFAGSTGQTPSVGMGFGSQTTSDFRPVTSTSTPSALSSTSNIFSSASSTIPPPSVASTFTSSSSGTPSSFSSSSSLFTSGTPFGQQTAAVPSNTSSGLFQNVSSSTVNPPNPMNNGSNNIFTGGSSFPSNSTSNSFGISSAPAPPANPMFATAPVNNFQAQSSNSQKILNYFTQKKKFNDNDISKIIIAMLDASFGGVSRAGKIFPIKPPTDKGKTNPALSDLSSPVSICFRRLPTSIDDINACFNADNVGGKNDVGIMYRFDASSPILRAVEILNVGDVMKAFFEVMFSRVPIASLTPYITRHMNASSQIPSASSVFNPSGSTGTFSAFSSTVAAPPQPLTSHPFANNTNFGSAPAPILSVSQPPVQAGPVFAISLFDNLKELDHHEHFYDDVSACVLRTNDGDTFDIGAIIPVDQYVGCKKVTSGGKVHDKGMCLLHGSQAQGKFGFNFNGRIQGIDAAEYHFRVTGKKIQSTREGWYAKLLMEHFFNKINEERADLRASFHGLGMYGRYQVTLKLNGVSVGEALTHMTYQGRPVAVAGYNGEHKSKFSEQFESFDFDALTNDPNEIANMNATVAQDLPRFISFFRDYKKNVDGKIVQSVSSQSNIFSSNTTSFGATSTPSQVASNNSTLFANQSAAALFSSAPVASATATPFGNTSSNAALFSSAPAPTTSTTSTPFGNTSSNAALFSSTPSATATPFGNTSSNAALFSSTPAPAPAPAATSSTANLFGNASSNATLFSSAPAPAPAPTPAPAPATISSNAALFSSVPAPAPAPASNPFGANSVSAPTPGLPFGVAPQFNVFASSSEQQPVHEQQAAPVSQFIIQPTTTSSSLFNGASSGVFSSSSLSQPNVPLVYDRQDDQLDDNGNLLTSVEDEDHDDDNSENEIFAPLGDDEPEFVQNEQADEDYDEVIPFESVF